MSLPLSSVVSTTATVVKPAFTVEKQHMLLAIVSSLVPTTSQFLEFTSTADFKNYFGSSIPEYTQVQKYFNFLSKTGLTPDKLVVGCWYKNNTQAFYKGKKVSTSLTSLKTIDSGSFKITFGTETFEVVIDMSSINSYSDIAELIQTAIRTNTAGNTAFTSATCVYNSITNGFIITNGTLAGNTGTVGVIAKGETGTDISSLLGLLNCELSQGANAETWTEFCDRIYNANSTGYSITTIETLTDKDIEDSIAWLQTIQDGQTYNTAVRLVFNYNNLENLTTLMGVIQPLNYSGYVIDYDPNNQYVNILDCAICASCDFEAENGTQNFNFQPANGYTAITNYGTITDYQAGQTNAGLVKDLDNMGVSYIYSLGAGVNEKIYYGKGLVNGSFGTEDVQTNETWLEKSIQISVINAFNNLLKVKLQGKDATELINKLVAPSFKQGQLNGAIAYEGILLDSDKITISQTLGANAVDTVQNNGYYYKIQQLTATDIANRQVRIKYAYICGGVVNRIVCNSYIYGA